MGAEEKIQKLIAKEDEVLADCTSRLRVVKFRNDAFAMVIEAIKLDDVPAIYKAISAKMTKELAMHVEIIDEMRAARTRKEALMESLRLFEKPSPDQIEKDLRASSELFTVREFIRKAGKPVPLSVIVQNCLGYLGGNSEGFEAKYASLRGTLNGYAKEGRVFTIESKPPESEGHVIGLIEFKEKKLVIPPRKGPGSPPARPAVSQNDIWDKI